MKKLIFVVIALFMLNNCGYTPIHSSNNNNFYIDVSQKNRNKFSLKEYEKDIEDNLINKIVKESIIYLSDL